MRAEVVGLGGHIAWALSLTELLHASLVFGGFLVALFIATVALPGRMVDGLPRPDGTHKRYKLNAVTLFLATTSGVIVGTLRYHLSLAPLCRHVWSLFVVANLFSLLWSALLYVQGRKTPRAAARHRHSWTFALHDFWFGTELDPSVFGVDLKMFIHHFLRIGLWLFVASFAYVQYETYGRISTQMRLFQLLWWGYLVTDCYYEEVMLSSFEVIAEKFGFLMVWSHLVLGLLYGIGGWYLVHLQEPMSAPAAAGISLLYVLGTFVARGSNVEKHRFKKDPSTMIWGTPAQAIGGKLLISGWWGIGRKINYAGEIAVYLAISLTTGFHSIVPYLLPLFLFVVLAQRAERDERRCRGKYGALWDAYCARVPFRMVPFVY